MSLIFDWSALQTLTTDAGTGGILRQSPHDFQVDELPTYALSGSGEYLYLWLQKEGHTTAHVIRELSLQLGLRDKDIGVAGLKDRHAMTRQWLSIPARHEKRLSLFSLEGVQILATDRHINKLGMGHLRGNHFTIRIRQPHHMVSDELLQRLSTHGIPNYFGPQRFGLGGLNAEEGLRVMLDQSKIKDPRVRRFLMSSVQSALFNAFVSLRIQRGLFDAVVTGDMAKKHDTNGVFMVEDAALESKRALAGEISATGTLFGRKIKPLTQEAGLLEAEVLNAFSLTPADFSARKGDRRFIRVFPQNLSAQHHDDGFTLSFSLPKGSFATSLLREVTKTTIDQSELREEA